jgi:hypothetical protein
LRLSLACVTFLTAHVGYSWRNRAGMRTAENQSIEAVREIMAYLKKVKKMLLTIPPQLRLH